MRQIVRRFYSKESPNLRTRGGATTMAESSHTDPHTSLRFMPTRHEIGLRRNASTVSNCAQREKKLDQLGTGRRGEMTAYTFLGVFNYECVATEDGGHEDLELQVHEVLAHTCPIIHADHNLNSPRAVLTCCRFADLGPYEKGLNVF